MKEKGYIYIITNPGMAGYIKIGYAKDVTERIRTFNTGSIHDYEVYATFEVYDYQVDKQLHGIIELLNPRLRVPNKEFFRMEPEEVYELLERIAKITNTTERLVRWEKGKPIPEPTQEIIEEVKEILEEKKTKRPPFKFSMIGLKKGDKIISTIDTACEATVESDKSIIFRGTEMSLSGSVPIIMHEHNRQMNCWAFQGTAYWSYNCRTLEELRKEKEEE